MMKKKTACALFLTAVTCALGAVTSLGDAQAHYVNRASWLTLAKPTVKAAPVSADCLEAATAPPLVNLLGQLPEEGWEIPIILTGGENRFGELTWTADPPEVVTVGMRIGSRVLNPGDRIGVSQSAPTRLMMTVKPTALWAQTGEPVNIQITWGDALTATFRCDPAVEETGAETAASLEGPGFFNPQKAFPLAVTPEKAGQVTLGIPDGEGAASFPAGTRFSPDQGETWYRLYREEGITLNAEAAKTKILLLDLSQTALSQENSVTVMTQSGKKWTLTAQTQPEYTLSGRVLTQNQPITLTVSPAFQEGKLTYTLEQLTYGEGETVYLPVTPEGLTLTEEGEGNLTLSVQSPLPQPGTYRLTLSRSYQGVSYWEAQIPFFINYTEESIHTGGAEQ